MKTSLQLSKMAANHANPEENIKSEFKSVLQFPSQSKSSWSCRCDQHSKSSKLKSLLPIYHHQILKPAWLKTI